MNIFGPKPQDSAMMIFFKIVTCALNVGRVKKEEYERKERRRDKKNPDQSSSYLH